MNNQIQINTYNTKIIKDELTDEQLLRAIARKTYRHVRDFTHKDIYEQYDKERAQYDEYYFMDTSKYFWTNMGLNLGTLEKILMETAQELKRRVTYKPHKKILDGVILELQQVDGTGKTWNESTPYLIDNVINDVKHYYGDTDENAYKQLADAEDDPVKQAEFIISRFKPMINLICKILRENEFKERLYY